MRSGGGGGGGGGKKIPWSVFDMVKPFPPPPSPETLMADIDAAIAASELAASNQNSQQKQAQDDQNPIGDDDRVGGVYDARAADEAYRAACAALASGRHDAAVRSLRASIASCPPDKASAVSKLRSLMAIAESQLKKQRNH